MVSPFVCRGCVLPSGPGDAPLTKQGGRFHSCGPSHRPLPNLEPHLEKDLRHQAIFKTGSAGPGLPGPSLALAGRGPVARTPIT
ncbi:hypothetical protein RGUI_2937 [Rhodovulum sp. P5]|nr:hypothetical protein RGUI_2937 [Rhodovulum sp. P5]